MVEPEPTKVAVEFGDRGNSAQFCRGGGWSPAEPKHTWTVGLESALELPLPARSGVYLLNLTLAPFVFKERLPAQKLTVVVNGKEIKTNTVRERASIEYKLPWELLEGRDSIDVVFKHPNAAKPAEVNGVPDQRQIAFAFEAVTLTRSIEEAQSASKSSGNADGASLASGSEALSLADLALKFENLGENCEFGLVQRRFGSEPLGLLRFSSTPILKLIDALDMRFEDLGRPDLVDVRASGSGKEYMVLDKKFGFLYHPWVNLGDATPKEIHARECGRLPFLVTKLIEDLEDGRKIFVYHGMRPLAESTVLRLVEAVRRYSKATLLWVEVEDGDNPAGAVKELTPGLLKGYIDRFAPGENAHEISLEMWVTICRNAYALAQRSELVAQ
jgi:hypothetical protein